MRQLFVVLIFIVAISGCMHVPERPYCKNHIANATLSYFRGIEEDNSTYIFSKINGYDKLKYLDRMYADAEGISEGDPEYLELKAKLRQKLMQGNADMFYACDDDSEVFLCVTYDVDERLSREYEPETVTWRWCLPYPFFNVTYDLSTHKFVEIGFGYVSGWDIEHLQNEEE